MVFAESLVGILGLALLSVILTAGCEDKTDVAPPTGIRTVIRDECHRRRRKHVRSSPDGKLDRQL